MMMLDEIASIGNSPVGDKCVLFEEKIKRFVTSEFVRGNYREKLDPDGYIRVSSIPYMCPRDEVWYALTDELQYKEKERLRITFDFGKAFEGIIRDNYLAPMEILKGDWECAKCGYVVQSEEEKLIKPYYGCPSCNAIRWKYHESELVNEQYKITGHCDGIVELDGNDYVLEIKSCNAYFFKLFKNDAYSCSFFSKYLIQIQMYMWLSGIHNGIFLFFNKDSSTMYSLPVSYSESIVDDVLKFVSDIRHCIRNSILPECTCKKQDHVDLKL